MSRARTGVVSAWLSIALVGLVAIMALALDAGQVLVNKEAIQKACDAGALAAATTDSDSISWAASYYAHNAFPNLDVIPRFTRASGATRTYSVGGDTLTITHPYTDNFTQGKGYSASHLYRVAATRSVPSTFARLLGSHMHSASASAVAWRYHVSAPLPAIFARRFTTAPYGIQWAGSKGVIEGDLVANWSVEISGSDHIIHGSVYYGQSYSLNGTGHDADGFFKLASPRDWPVSLSPSSFQPYTYVINGKFHIKGGGVIPAGVYFVNGDVTIDGSDYQAGGVTFIATGRIKVSGSNHYFTPARNNVLFYSLSSGGGFDIDISGSGGYYEGTCYAPNGSIQFLSLIHI
ncbi:MAG: pilus assembly protein TadG-related protein, partial [Armatimonadetes bacterium]|nr:pilus assembly protein TadG-related protein [Armatimonadota bacterium]